MEWLSDINYSFSFLLNVFFALIYVAALSGSKIRKSKEGVGSNLSLEINLSKLVAGARFEVLLILMTSFVVYTYAYNTFDPYNLAYVKVLVWFLTATILFYKLGLFNVKFTALFVLYFMLDVFNYWYSTKIFGSNMTPGSGAEALVDISHAIASITVLIVMFVVVAKENGLKEDEKISESEIEEK